MAEDYGHQEADRELAELLERLHEAYTQASEELKKKIDDYLDQFEEEDAEKRALCDSGELSHEAYMSWRTQKIAGTNQWLDMLEQITNDMVHQNEIAASMINDTLPDVYAVNHDYGTYEAETGSGIDTSYTLYDRFTVTELLKEDKDLLPAPSDDIPEDTLWNRQHFQSSILQGILQGESMSDIAKRLVNVVGMNERAAMRNARTAVTGAENAGRVASYQRAEKMGIKMKQVWMATLDNRVRDSHALLDGEKVDPGKKFSNGCRYPGDPQGAPAEIYNCRCTLVGEVEGSDKYDPSDLSQRANKLEGMTYEEWKEMHREEYFTKLFSEKNLERYKGLSSEEHAWLYTEYSNKVPVQALEAPGFIEKFANITGNAEVDKAIYDSAVEILKNRNGTNGEDLHIIDMVNGEVFYKHTRSTVNNAVEYDDDLIQAIADAHKNEREIIAIHNHPNGLPPSLDDGSSALSHQYDLGIAVGHNLEVWTYGKANKIYPPEFCEEVHSALGLKFQYVTDFDDNEWYNLLNAFGMEVKRL